MITLGFIQPIHAVERATTNFKATINSSQRNRYPDCLSSIFFKNQIKMIFFFSNIVCLLKPFKTMTFRKRVTCTGKLFFSILLWRTGERKQMICQQKKLLVFSHLQNFQFLSVKKISSLFSYHIFLLCSGVGFTNTLSAGRLTSFKKPSKLFSGNFSFLRNVERAGTLG